jgi:AraC-like DNA-binding protein
MPLSASPPTQPFQLPSEEELWRQRVGGLCVAPRLIRELGANPYQALAAAGLPASAFDLPENTIPFAAYGRFMHVAAQITDCEHFGLRLGQVWELRSLGLLGELMRNAPTVRDALRLGFVYHHLNNQGGIMVLREHGSVAELGYAAYRPGVVGVRQICDGALATGVNYLRELCGPAWVPTEVLLAHSPPADPSPFRQLFRSPVRFNAELNTLRFPSHWLDQPVKGADPQLLRQLQAQANARVPPDLVERLRRALRVLLLNRVVSGDAVAEMLAMHRRTLNRRLQALGTTFREVLDDVRYEAAFQLLDSTELPVEEIAEALGYASVSPFTRAFRRRTGMPPGHWRRKTHSGDGCPLETPESSAAVVTPVQPSTYRH